MFQQYLRNQNMFCIWDISRDCMAPFLSKNNFHPPARPIENGVFNMLGRGNWQSCKEAVLDAMDWKCDPWEIVCTESLRQTHPNLADRLGNAKDMVKNNFPDCLSRSILATE